MLQWTELYRALAKLWKQNYVIYGLFHLLAVIKDNKHKAFVLSGRALLLLEHVLLPDSKVHGANMGPTRGRQDPGGSHVGPMNLTIRAYISLAAFVYW